MAICLTDWNLGMDDAEAGLPSRAGMGPDYYGGYYYACALNYEQMGGGATGHSSLAEPLMALARAVEGGCRAVKSADGSKTPSR